MYKTLKNLKASIVTFLLIFAVTLTPVNVQAQQSKSDNYSKKYTLTDSQADNLVAVAKAQLGKTKSNLGYSESWCADFVSDCAKIAGLSDAIPFTGRASGLYKAVLKAGGKKVKKAKAGDLVFYHCKSCGRIVHTGIMISSKESVEGNYSRKVSLVGKADYRDSCGHSVKSKTVVKKYVRPAYGDASYWNVSSAILKKGTSTNLLIPTVSGNSKVKKYISSNKKVATVSKNGKITAKKTGTVYITAVTSSGDTSVVKLKVQKGTVKTTSIIIDCDSYDLNPEETISLDATVNPITSAEKLEFSCDDDSVATVDKNGNVKAVAEGDATVTATSGSVSITINIKVGSN